MVKVNTDENPQACVKYGVLTVPTINLFSGGEVVKQVIGARSKSALLREFAEFIYAPDASAVVCGRPPAVTVRQ